MQHKPRRSVADYPALVATLHPTKNGSLRPEQVSRGSGRKLWWKCPKGPDHEWQAAPLLRTRPSSGGCPFWSGKRVSVTNSLATLNPRVSRDWHPGGNAGVHVLVEDAQFLGKGFDPVRDLDGIVPLFFLQPFKVLLLARDLLQEALVLEQQRGETAGRFLWEQRAFLRGRAGATQTGELGLVHERTIHESRWPGPP